MTVWIGALCLASSSGGLRLLGSERLRVDGVVTVVGVMVCALLTQEGLQLVAVESPDFVT
jgi:hypothetical protein